MISIKEYAEKNHISYEAVRKQVARYRDTLKEHIIVQGRTQYLDDDAIAYLDEKRATNPVVIIESDKNTQIEELRTQNENLKIKILDLQDQLIKSKDQLLERDKELIELKEQVYRLTLRQEENTADDDGSDETEEVAGDEEDGSAETEELHENLEKQSVVQPEIEAAGRRTLKSLFLLFRSRRK